NNRFMVSACTHLDSITRTGGRNSCLDRTEELVGTGNGDEAAPDADVPGICCYASAERIVFDGIAAGHRGVTAPEIEIGYIVLAASSEITSMPCLLLDADIVVR